MEENGNRQLDTISPENDEVYRSAVINAWISNGMERDKSLLTLSSGGIGLLVTILSFKETLTSCEILFYSLAFLAFIINIITVITIFSKNPDYLKKLLKENDAGRDSFLNFLDKTAVTSFSLGILFTIGTGIIQII